MAPARHIPNSAVLQTLEEIVRESHQSYVVGGAVRDMLLGAGVLDWDVVTDLDGFTLARHLAQSRPAELTFVALDEERGVGRVVVRDGRDVIDIAQIQENCISRDLLQRDFTVNAMAIDLKYFLHGEWPEVIDVTGGMADLGRRLVRRCGPDSLTRDPIRVLRAFRFAASLGFSITPETLTAAATSAPMLAGVAAERIRDEFMGILRAPTGVCFLREMDAVGIMDLLFPEVVPMKQCEQNAFHHLDVWGHTLAVVEEMESFFTHGKRVFASFWEHIADYLSHSIVPGRPKFTLVKLAALLHDSGKPQTRFVDEHGKVRFFGHEALSATAAENVCERLKLSRKETRCVVDLVKGHMHASILADESMSSRAMRRMSRSFGSDLIGLLLLFLADMKASKGTARLPGQDALALKNVFHVLEYTLEQQKTPLAEPFLSGRDIIELFCLQEGPAVGALLLDLQELQEAGRIATFQQALIAAAELAPSHGKAYQKK